VVGDTADAALSAERATARRKPQAPRMGRPQAVPRPSARTSSAGL